MRIINLRWRPRAPGRCGVWEAEVSFRKGFGLGREQRLIARSETGTLWYTVDGQMLPYGWRRQLENRIRAEGMWEE